MRADPHRGFTLVELLVVITIIGILIALLLPAVQAAREAARRSQCTNNLKQLGLAFHLHHEQLGHLPYGHYYPEPPEPSDHGTGSSWFPRLLSYLEQQALADMINWDEHFGLMSSSSQPNIEVCREVLSVFLCPSDTKVKPLEYLGNDAYARGNYLANNGLGPMRDSDYTNLPVIRDVPGTSTSSPYAAGAFYLNSQTRFADFHDGTSNTALLSEIRLTPGHDFRGVMFHGEGALYHHNRTPNSLVPDDIRESLCVNSNPLAPCVGAFTSWKPRAMIVTARSYHPGGVNLLLGDASVRFASQSIALDTWKALCTPRMVQDEVVVGDF